MLRKLIPILFLFASTPLFSQTPPFTLHQNLGKRMIQSDAVWISSRGQVDLVVLGEDMNAKGAVSTYYYKQGKGQKFALTNVGLPAVYDGSIGVADFNSDGNPAIFITGKNAQGKNISGIYLRQPNGTFKIMPGQTFIPLSGGSLQVDDFDGDDDFDLLICGLDQRGDPQTLVYTSELDSLSLENIKLPGIHQGMARWGDVNNDGFKDIILSGNSQQGPITRIYVYSAVEKKYKRLRQSFVGLYNSAVAFADFNNDGQLDFFIAGTQSDGNPYTRVFRGNRDLTFTDVTPSDMRQMKNISFDIGDFDADGDLDIIITGESNERPYTILYENLGNFVFKDFFGGFPAVTEGPVRFGNFDKDGDLDIYITGIDDCNDFYGGIFRNNLNPPFTPEEEYISEDVIELPFENPARGPYYYFVFSSCYCDFDNSGKKSYNAFVSNIHRENSDFELTYTFNNQILKTFPGGPLIDGGHRTSNAFISIQDAEEGRKQVIDSYNYDNFKVHYINW